MNILKAQALYRSAFIYKKDFWTRGTYGIDEFAVNKDSSFMTICFDGSNGLDEWWSNLKVAKVKNLHKGFFETARLFRPMIKNMIKSSNIKYLSIIPYSRGIYSLIIACDMAMAFPELEIEVVTFGAPKIGDLFSYADHKILESMNITHVVNRGDIVTITPPTWLGYKKRNPGEYVYFGSKANWIFPRISKHLHYFDGKL